MSGPSRISREVFVPQLEEGFLQYIVMDIVANSDFDNGWRVNFPLVESSAVPSTVVNDIGGHDFPKSGI